MTTTMKHGRITWVDVESPTPDEIKNLLKNYSIVHPLIAEELLEPSLRPRVDTFKDSAYLIFHFPLFDNVKKEFKTIEIDFILSKDVFITVHYDTVGPLVELSRAFESHALAKEGGFTTPYSIFFRIMRAMYEFVTYRLDAIHLAMRVVESDIFKKRAENYDLVRKISHIRKDILDYRRAIEPHRGMLESLTYANARFIGKDLHAHHSYLIGEHFKLSAQLENDKETIESVQATNDSLLSNRANDIMKTLTIMAFATFPLMLLTSIFSMNTRYLPIVGIRGDFWIIVFVMALATAGFFIFFKRKRWL